MPRIRFGCGSGLVLFVGGLDVVGWRLGRIKWPWDSERSLKAFLSGLGMGDRGNWINIAVIMNLAIVRWTQTGVRNQRQVPNGV